MNFGCSTVCWQNWLGSKAAWWNMQIHVNPTKVPDQGSYSQGKKTARDSMSKLNYLFLDFFQYSRNRL